MGIILRRLPLIKLSTENCIFCNSPLSAQVSTMILSEKTDGYKKNSKPYLIRCLRNRETSIPLPVLFSRLFSLSFNKLCFCLGIGVSVIFILTP